MSQPSEIKTHVLLVDDDHDVLGANARFLRINSMEVTIADSASVALERLQQLPIDTVVTDLRMPDCDGISFARKARTFRPLLPIIFFSGYADVPDVVAAMKLGAVEFLEKPVDPEQLLSVIAKTRDSYRGALAQSRQAFDAADAHRPLRLRVLAYEKFVIESSLREHDGHIGSVLQALQINRRTLNDKMIKLGISREALSDNSNTSGSSDKE